MASSSTYKLSNCHGVCARMQDTCVIMAGTTIIDVAQFEVEGTDKSKSPKSPLSRIDEIDRSIAAFTGWSLVRISREELQHVLDFVVWNHGSTFK